MQHLWRDGLVASWPAAACSRASQSQEASCHRLSQILILVVLAAFSVLLIIPGDWVLAVIFVSVALLTREAIVDLFAIEMLFQMCSMKKNASAMSQRPCWWLWRSMEDDRRTTR